MGLGHSSLADRNVGPAGSDISELPGYSNPKSLGAGRFLKTIRARHEKGTAVVKIFLKPGPGYPIKKYVRQIERRHLQLSSCTCDGINLTSLQESDWHS